MWNVFFFVCVCVLPLSDRNSEDRQESTEREMGSHADQTQTRHMVACSPTELNQHPGFLIRISNHHQITSRTAEQRVQMEHNTIKQPSVQ